jgi:hypothetical protein
MRVRLQVRHMWEAVQYDDVDYYKDRRALDVLIVAVPPEMQFSLFKKRTTKEAWDAITVARIGSNCACKITLHALHKEWENLTFKPGENVDDFALHLNTLQQKMVQFSDDTYGEERAIEKLFRCIPEKYKQITRSIESLLDLSTMSIEEAIGRINVVLVMNHNLSQDLSPSTGSYISLGNNGRLARVTGRRGSLLPRRAAASTASHARRTEAPRLGREDVLRVAPAEAPPAVPLATRSRHETMPTTTVTSLAIGPRSVDTDDVIRPTSHRWWRRRSQLCSWHTQASSYLQRHQPQRLSSTLMSQEHTPSSAMAPATTRLAGGASTPVPPII